MCKGLRSIFFVFLLTLTNISVRANHILGGNFELNNTGTNGSYELKLNLFFDKAVRSATAADNNIKVAIYQKSNNRLMKSIILTTFQLAGSPFVYSNENCAASQGLKITVISFSQDIFLDPTLYTDPNGYYVIWDRCCRNAADNINNSSGSGMLFYLEFPPLQTNAGADFINSSPKFSVPNGEYICAGQPFTFDNGASDIDGDQLRYSLVTPYSGFSSSSSPAPDPRPSSNFPTINWGSGFSATTAIPSNPAMSINPNTGSITVTSSQLGLYVYSVLVEELRGGVVIGQVRRDFQLKVINCNAPPAQPIVYDEKTPSPVQLTQIDVCDNGFAELATKDDLNYQYQWQKDNINIANADKYKLKVTEAGEYTVVISYKQGCSGSTTSEKTAVSIKPGEKFKINPDNIEFCETAAGVPLQIQKDDGSAFNAGDYLYLWTRDITDVLAIQNVFIQATKTGKYVARMTQISGVCQYELESTVKVNSLPDAFITNPLGKKIVCEGDTIPLKISDGSSYQYDWQIDDISVTLNTISRYSALKSGTYKVIVTDGNNCQKTSDTLKLTFNPLTPVTFDTIFPTCGSNSNRINLMPYVQPYDVAKGIFSGRGVSGTIYSPLLAGFGPSPIVYSYTNDYGCTTKKSRIAYVDLTPKVRLGNDIIIFKGDTTSIKSSITGGFKNDITLYWTPSTGLNSNTISRPLASPDATTQYILHATALSSGCTNEDTILITVKTKILTPSGFTPNGDGLNETWVLDGIEDYPNAEVQIFNRWGGEIFTTKNYANNPFNGKKDNSDLPMGTYYYVIKTGDEIPNLTGYITIVRSGQ
ncbi:gliding motility-associated C-terminal domain-containing protein [Arcicella sp. LKC2W]|uniref:gliding motility-associated C-terminal domain-containing protein n=1 Tax=Arcicella sp. LKC2W TaxID=2984198 RepID=UPI002B1F5284|nr:gliding motility-associated C-terminal domain-containing protein [Arcicella sp. LKC2W]MEA5459448.1 gliding motility-associated C-terminal domain-containing protein [Arcicella sp. LKC2W]